MSRKITAFIFSFILFLSITPQVTHAEGVRWNEWQRDVRRGDVHLRSGGNVHITEDIDGDLLIAGGTVKVDGRVSGDLLIVGGDIEVNGNVDQNLRIVGGKVMVKSHVGRNISVVSGDMTIGENTLVDGNFVATGGRIKVDETATIRGKSYITTPPQGRSDFERNKTRKPFGIVNGIGTAFTLLSTFVMGTLLILLFPKTVERIGANARKKIGTYFIRGIITTIILSIVLLVAAFTIIGIPAALILLFALIAGWYVAGLLARILIGQYLYRLVAKNRRSTVVKKSHYMKIFIIGVLAFFVLGFVPFLGWGVKTFLTFVALGLLIEQKLHNYRLIEK